MLRRLSVLTLIMSLSFAAGARSAPVEPDHLAADTDWLVHVDMTRLNNSALGASVRAALEDEPGRLRWAEGMAHYMQNRLKLDPFQDVRGVTLAGRSGDRPIATMIIDVAGEAQSLLKFAKQHKTHEATTVNDHTIHSWQPREKKRRRGKQSQHRQYLARVAGEDDGSLLVLAHRAEAVIGALKVIEGDRDNLDDADSGLLDDNDASEQAVLFATANNLRRIPRLMRHSTIAKVTEQATLSVSIEGQQVSTILALRAIDEEKASHVQQLSEGMVALARLKADPDDRPALAAMTDGATVERDDRVVRVTLKAPAKRLIAMMQHHEAREHRKHKQRRHDEKRHKHRHDDKDDGDRDPDQDG